MPPLRRQFKSVARRSLRPASQPASRRGSGQTMRVTRSQPKRHLLRSGRRLSGATKRRNGRTPARVTTTSKPGKQSATKSGPAEVRGQHSAAAAAACLLARSASQLAVARPKCGRQYAATSRAGRCCELAKCCNCQCASLARCSWAALSCSSAVCEWRKLMMMEIELASLAGRVFKFKFAPQTSGAELASTKAGAKRQSLSNWIVCAS